MTNNIKSEVLRFRLSPELKEDLRSIAKAEHRTMSNLLEIIVRRYVDEHKKDSAEG
jgi:predicted transcriptional regulator